MDFLRLAAFASALAATNCRSLDGLTGGAHPTSDSGTDAGFDAGFQPDCVASQDKGTVCVSVSLDPNGTSPGYGAFSGAGTVKADGTGFVQVFLFDKDPTDPANGHVLPKITLRDPPAAGSTTTIDSLPRQLVGNADPGTYFVYAFFLDNEVDSRGTGLLSTLPGDFVTPQAIGQADLFPKVTLIAGDVTKTDVGVVPLRELAMNCSAAPALLSQAQSDPKIHGDGPAAFFIFDGSLMSPTGPSVVDFGQVNCLDLQLQNPARPASIPVSIGVFTTGSHSAFGSVFDYQSPNATGSALTPGTVETSAFSPPQVDIDPTSWTSNLDMPFNDVFQPVAGSTNDSLHCN